MINKFERCIYDNVVEYVEIKYIKSIENFYVTTGR